MWHQVCSHDFPEKQYLKGKLVFLLVREGNVLWHHLSQVVLHKIHGEAESLFDLISGGPIIVIAAEIQAESRLRD